MKEILLSLFVVALLTVQPALAQDEKVSVQQRGADSITLSVNYDSVGIGYWHKMTEQTDLGVDFSLLYRNHQHYDSQQYQVTPALRYFLLPQKSVSPYLYAGLLGSYNKHDNDYPTSKSSGESYAAGALGGIGLQWFPVQSVSIGGHVGVHAQYESDRVSNSDQLSLHMTNKSEGFALGTFNSGIQVNLFF